MQTNESAVWRALPLVGLLLLALLSRAPVVTIPPLTQELGGLFGLSSVQLALLTSIPVLCFGVLTPAVSQLVHWIGINHAVVYGLAAVIAGSLWRSDATVVGLFGGTVLLGIGLTIGNLAIPMLISRQYRGRSALLTGSCSATTNVAVTLATALTVPVASLVGWQASSSLWGVLFGVPALLLWILVYPPGIRGVRPWVARRAGRSEEVQTVRSGRAELRGLPRPSLLRRPAAWLLAAAFAGHTLSYYAVTAWLPASLMDLRGLSAGGASLAASVFQVAGVAGPFIVPWLVGRRAWSTLRCTVLIGCGWAALPLGMIVLPSAWPAWSVVSGAAQGAFFTLLFMVVVARSSSVDGSRRLSAMVQTIGYATAATGPVLLGWIHTSVGDWRAAFAVVLTAVFVMASCLIAAVRRTSPLA